MTEKEDFQKTKREKNPLGKSLSDILAQTVHTSNTIPALYNQTVEAEAIKEDSHNSIYPINLFKIGKILKEKREENGITIQNVSDKLCLRYHIIQSIELGDWEDLPHKVYVKGFIKKYAALLEVFDEILPYLIENQPEKNTETTEKKSNQKKEMRLNFLLPSGSRVPNTVFIYSAVVALILGFFIFDRVQKDSTETAKLENAMQVASSVSDSTDKRGVPNISDTKKLMITCHERTWVSVIIDGTEKKEFTLKPQEVMMLNAKEKFDLLIGNAAGVKLLLNGKDTGFTGGSGQVKRVTLS